MVTVVCGMFYDVAIHLENTSMVHYPLVVALSEMLSSIPCSNHVEDTSTKPHIQYNTLSLDGSPSEMLSL